MYSDNKSTHTRDGIPITKVYVKKIPKGIPRREIVSVFSAFGAVKSCFIKYHPNDSDHILYAFIGYSCVKNALAARTSSVHIRNQRLIVLPADSWHQRIKRGNPINFHDSLPDVSNENEEVDVQCDDDSEPNILNILNEDCLLKIFEYFDLSQLIATERVSKRWRNIVREKYRKITSFNDADYSISLTQNVIYSIFSKIGVYLKTIQFLMKKNLDQRVPYLISKLCPNLVEIQIAKCFTNVWSIVFQKCVNLKVVKLYSCEISPKNKLLSRCNAQLEELSIVGCENLGNFLHGYTSCASLKKLSIVYCNVDDGPLLKSLVNCVNLKELHVFQTELDNALAKKLLPKLSQLTHLSLCEIDLTDGFAHIAKLDKLECLQLSSNSYLEDETLKAIIDGCPLLTSLVLDDNDLITDEGISYALTHKNLEYLNVSYLDISDRPFKTMSRNKGSKLTTIICNGNRKVTEEMVFAVYKYCPKIEKVDALNCNVDEEKILTHQSHAALCNILKSSKRKVVTVGGILTTSYNIQMLINNYENYEHLLDDINFMISDDDLDTDSESSYSDLFI